MKQALCTVDLGFGDAGKGSIVDYLTREYDAHTVIRYNGGAQAGHRVVTAGPNQSEHVFSQFGSGTLAGACTHLSRYMLIEPLAMMEEEKHLRFLGTQDAFERTTIDSQAPIITPFHRAVNRLRELSRGDKRHGSCGLGIGETMSDLLRHDDQVLFAGDLGTPERVRSKLRFLRDINLRKVNALAGALPDSEQVLKEMAWLTDESVHDWLIEEYVHFAGKTRIMPGTFLDTILQRPGSVIFEGAQGVLLDEWYGFHPHTTWGTTTLAQADRLLDETNYDGRIQRIGITRTYATRHGAGPLVTEDQNLTGRLPDPRNELHPWQQGFRVGWPDLVLLQYARELVGPLDRLALTCVDRLAELPELRVCHRYRHGALGVDRLIPANKRSLTYQRSLTMRLLQCVPELAPVDDIDHLTQLFQSRLEVSDCILSYGPTAEDKRVIQRQRAA